VKPRKSALILISLLSLTPLLLGTNSCREDYDLGSRTSNTGTETVTPTGSVSPTPDEDDDDDGLVTRTPTFTPTATGSLDSLTPTATPTPQAVTPTPMMNSLMKGIVRDLNDSQAVDRTDSNTSARNTGNISTSSERIAPNGAGNWLGNAFNKDKEDTESDKNWKDSDGDGFSDSLEKQYNTDYQDLNSTPAISFELNEQNDLDINAVFVDKDGNDCPDVTENFVREFIQSRGSNEANDVDSDNDCLPSSLEELLGSSDQKADSDEEGLLDSYEVALGTDLNKQDTDGDGVRDITEVDLNGNPLVQDVK
jgi:Bacterial TSP3 repeat